MKKKAILNIMAGALCLTLLTSGMAFAETSVQINATPVDGQNQGEVAQQEQKFVVEKGTIAEVAKTGDTYRIHVKNEGMGMIFFVDSHIFIFDQVSGKQITPGDLKEGMNLTGILPANSPMTLSLPPQTSHAVAFAVTDDRGSVDVSVYDASLTNQNNTLKLKISEDTQIVDTKGSAKAYTEADIKNRTCAVLYTVATASLPGQTCPEAVILLGDAQEQEVKPAAPEYVSLRDVAEAKGYKVQWTSNKKPIILMKNDMEVQVTLGSDQFEFTHMTKDLKALDQMEKMALPAVLQGGQTMVADSFAEALE